MNNFFEERLTRNSQAARFSVGGKIRVGTKAISKKTLAAAATNPKVANILARLRDGKVSFREAEKELYKTANLANPFYPRNTREFHAHPWDMGIGGLSTSRKLLQMYGEMMEGDTEVKLYKFPVVFPEIGRDAHSIVEGGLSVQGGGPETVRYWSAYDQTGVRVCMQLPEVRKHDQTQRRTGRAIRHPERQPISRGACDPGTCFEFQNGMCRFNGTVRFYVPGIPGAGVFELHTGSTQAATEIYLRLTEALRATGGRLQNYTPDGNPVFWLTKRLSTRKYFDEEGSPKMGEQWVPMLEMEIEMPKVLWLAQQAKSAGALPSGMATPSAWMQTDSQGSSSSSFSGLTTAVVMNHQDAKILNQSDDVADPEYSSILENDKGAAESESVDRGEDQSHGGTGESDKGGNDSRGTLTGPEPSQALSTQTLEDDVKAMFAHASENGYKVLLDQWIEDKQQANNKRAAHNWGRLLQRLGARTKDFIDLVMWIHAQKMHHEMTLQYLGIKFGAMGNGQKIADMKAHLQDLASDGVSVAMSVIEETVDAQTE